MRNALTIPFQLDGHALRIEADADGEPLFNVPDLCRLLGYSNARDALRRHADEDDVVKRDTIDRMGRHQHVNYVREPGMYALLLGSETDGARRVKRWVTAEVLPALRRRGAYSMAGSAAAAIAAELLRARPDLDQVARLVRAGFTSAEIGGFLGLGRDAVDKRRAKLKALGLLEVA